MLVELDDSADDQTADAGDYRRRIGPAVKDATPKGRIRLRHVVARMVYDLAGIIGNEIANHVAAHMMETAAGRKGLMHAESMQGVDDETAAAFELKRTIICLLRLHGRPGSVEEPGAAGLLEAGRESSQCTRRDAAGEGREGRDGHRGNDPELVLA